MKNRKYKKKNEKVLQMCETTKYLIFVSSIPETKAKESVTKEHLKK